MVINYPLADSDVGYSYTKMLNVIIAKLYLLFQGMLRHSTKWLLAGSFAALLADGSVVTWGKADFGGDSSKVQEDLEGVAEQVFSLSLLSISSVWGIFWCIHIHNDS